MEKSVDGLKKGLSKNKESLAVLVIRNEAKTDRFKESKNACVNAFGYIFKRYFVFTPLRLQVSVRDKKKLSTAARFRRRFFVFKNN